MKQFESQVLSFKYETYWADELSSQNCRMGVIIVWARRV
jgi:hypothetical protein